MIVLRAVALAALLTALAPSRARAHGELVGSSPAAGDRLATAPTELRLRFTEALALPLARLQLIGPNGVVELGQLFLPPDSAMVLIASIEGAVSGGAYTVRWQIAGEDGHPVRGEYTFEVAPEAAGSAPLLPPAPGQGAPPAEHHPGTAFPESSGFGASSPGYAFIRWATYAGLVVVIGAVVFGLLVLGLIRRSAGDAAVPFTRGAEARATAVGLCAAALLLVAGPARLYAQSYALHGLDAALSSTLLATLLGRTLWGWGWLTQAVATILVALGFAAARGGRRGGWRLVALGALALAFTPALSGHAVAAPEMRGVTILADALHVVGAGGWLGGLLLVLVAGLPVALRGTDPGRAVASLVGAFSPIALLFAGLVVSTGLFAAWIHMGSVAALWDSGYGRTLLLKLALLIGVFGTGAYNWLRVKPALGDPAAARRLKRSGTVELAVGVIVLAVTSVLVATGAPATEADRQTVSGVMP